MLERCTGLTQSALFFSRYEANLFGSPHVESEHLLLGLLREHNILFNYFKHAHGTVESIRKEIEERTPFREKVPTSIDLPFSDECKRILAYAADEADNLLGLPGLALHKFIGTEHVFLGVLRVPECFAAALLRERGINLEITREQIGKMCQGQVNNPSMRGHPIPKSPGLPTGYRLHRLFYNSAAETLILELRASPNFLLQSRLFVRRRDKETYEQIGGPPEEVSYESPVTCERLPLVMFNSVKRGTVIADWEGVYSYNLNSKELKLCITPEHLRLPEAHGGLSIRELVSLSEDAQTVRVIIAVERIAPRSGIIQYHLANVDLRDQQVNLLSRLLDTRF